jgi:broad specificity phosphatase PhoE
MAVYLIRHGETEANASRILQRPEVPLSPRGIFQAQRLAARLAGAGITRIVSSDLARAAMTAAPLAHATGAALDFDPLLQERSFGDLRGTPYAELGLDPFAEGYAPPGGESWEVFFARTARAWARVEEVSAGTHGHLAVVTHGLFCRAVVSRHATLSAGMDAGGRGWPNTSVTILERTPGWQVRLLACTAHLEGEGVATGPA